MGAQGIRAGRAFVELFADDSKLVRGLRKAQQRTEAWAASTLKIGAGLFAFGGGIVGALVAMSKSFADAGDEIDKMSARTGVGAEALSSLKFAAEQTGAGAAEIEKGFFGLSRSLFDAQRGSAEATEAFGRLGLTVEDLAGLNPEEQFKKVADGLSRVADESTRGAIAQKLFGRAGRQLLPLLASGSAAIEELQAEAAALGITLSTDQTKAAAELTDAWNRVTQQLKGVVIQIGGALAPTLTALSAKLAETLKAVLKWVKENGALVVTLFKLASVVAIIGAAALAMGFAFKAAAIAQAVLLALSGPKGWAILAVGVAAAVVATAALNSTMNKSGREARSAAAGISAAGEAVEGLASGGGGGEDRLRGLLVTIQKFADRIRELKSLEDTGLAILPVIQGREEGAFKEEFISQLRRFHEAASASKRPVDELRAALDRLKQDVADGVLPAEFMQDIGSILENEIGKKSGIAEAIKAANDQLDIMLGRVTDIDLQVEKFLEGGALPEQAAQLRELLEKIERAKQADRDEKDREREEQDRKREEQNEESRLASLAESVTRETRTPEERFEERLQELESIRNRIDPQTFERAVAQAQEQLDASLQQDGGNVAGKVSSKSIGSFNARAIAGSAFGGPEKETAKNTKAMLAEQKKTNQTLKQGGGLAFA